MTRYTFWTFFLCIALLCPVLSFAQGGSRQKITSIPGGFFVEWASPVNISAVQLDKKLSGGFEIMFDVPSVGFIAEISAKKEPRAVDPATVTALADYWIVRGKPERAIPLYEESLKRGDIDEARALVFQNNLAMLYSQVLKQHGKALDVVNKALESKKDNFTLLDTKGLIYLNSGDPASAIPPLERAVELSCQLPIYCMHLAYALMQDGGRVAPARRWFDPVRPKLIEAAPGMTKENKEMFDSLQISLPPVVPQ